MTARHNRREAWLNKLAAMVETRGPTDVAESIWRLVLDELQSEGMDGVRASQIARRHALLAGYLVRRMPQRAAAHRLGVDPRTARRDAQRLRTLVEDGRLAAPAGRWAPTRGAPGPSQ